MLLLALTGLIASAAAEDAPDEGSFGADVSAGLAAGTLLGEWPTPGLGGAFTVRYDAFIQTREQHEPRVGISLFGGGSLWPLQDSEEVQADGEIVTAPIRYYHWGVLGIIRYDPSAPWGGTFGLGFSRLDLEDYYGGPLGLPVLVIEGGARRRLGPDGPLFLDLMVRGGWGSARGAPYGEQPDEWTDWWSAQGVLALGMHVR